MFKFLFKKINNFIQWTKKWHCMHITIIPLFIILTLIYCDTILDYIFLAMHNINKANAEIINDLEYIIGYPILSFTLIAYIGIIISTIIILVKYFKKRTINVENNILLNNKIYGYIYTSTLIFTAITSIISFIYSFSIALVTIVEFIIPMSIIMPIYACFIIFLKKKQLKN